jgi:4-hydroxybenzoate polyprenyltransferase/phosphoserine phosphatase
MEADSPLPICVDLDGTLFRSDTLWEALSLALRRAPAALLAFPFHLLKGRAHAKHRLAQAVTPSFAMLPRNPELAEYLRAQKAAGRRIYLVSAASQDYVAQAAAGTGLFDEAVGSSETLNLKGKNKAAYLVDRFGPGGYAYAGDARADLPVWAGAGRVLVVNAAPSTVAAARALGSSSFTVLDARPSLGESFRTTLRLIRVHQWAKNVLVFVPLIAAHRIGDLPSVLDAVRAFFAFSFMASSIYIFNDFLDVEADRAHPRKRNRPFASGAMPFPQGFLLLGGLFVAALGLAASVSAWFLGVIVLYFIVTKAYSLGLKRIPIVDIFVLSFLYTIRILGGGVATGVTISHWLAAFSGFFFLGLGMAKRYIEILEASGRAQSAIRGRGYQIADAEIISNLGICAGFASTIVLALYVSSPEVAGLYRNPHLLWGICGLEIFWISYAWLVAHRGEMHDDPLVFALKDKTTYVLLAFSALVFFLARPI